MPPHTPHDQLQQLLQQHLSCDASRQRALQAPWGGLMLQNISSLLAAEQRYRLRPSTGNLCRLSESYVDCLLRRFGSLIQQFRQALENENFTPDNACSPLPSLSGPRYWALVTQACGGSEETFQRRYHARLHDHTLHSNSKAIDVWNALAPRQPCGHHVSFAPLPRTLLQIWRGLQQISCDYDPPLEISGVYCHFPAQPQGGGGPCDVFELSDETHAQFRDEPWAAPVQTFFTPSALIGSLSEGWLQCLDDEDNVAWQGAFVDYRPGIKPVRVKLKLRRTLLTVPAPCA